MYKYIWVFKQLYHISIDVLCPLAMPRAIRMFICNFFPHLVVPPVIKIKTPNPALLPENIDRLAYPPYRPVPKRSHAQKCDARYVSSYCV